MTKNLLRSSLLALTALSLLLGVVAPASAQDLTDTERRAIERAVADRTSFGTTLITKTYYLPLSETGAMLADFCLEFAKQNLANLYAADQLVAVVVLSDDPDTTSGAAVQVGFEVPFGAKVAPPLRVRQLAYASAVRYTNVGPYSKLGSVEDVMSAALPTGNRTAFPALMRLYTDPTAVEESQLRTELVVPIQ